MVPLEHKAVKEATAIVQWWTKLLELFIDFMEDQKSYYLLYLLYHNDFLRNLHYSGIHSCFPRTMIDSFHHFYMESFHMDSERKLQKGSKFLLPLTFLIRKVHEFGLKSNSPNFRFDFTFMSVLAVMPTLPSLSTNVSSHDPLVNRSSWQNV